MGEISKRGLGMKMVFRAPGNEAKVNQFNWAGEHSFGQELTPEDDEATTKQKVEKQVRKLTSDFKWNEDGSLELTQHIPGKAPAECFSASMKSKNLNSDVNFNDRYTQATGERQASVVQRPGRASWYYARHWCSRSSSYRP